MMYVSLLIILGSLMPSGMSDFLGNYCNPSGNYTAGSELKKNLDRVLQYLVANGPGDGYSTYSYGEIPMEMYGLFQCRGELSQRDCNNCSREAQKTIGEKCPNQVGGQVWFDDCFLRYDNQSFVSKLDTSFAIYYWSPYNNTNPSAFNKALGSLMDNLSSKAMVPVNKGFASGSTKYSSFNAIYAAVQCLRDLSADDCESCLSTAIGRIPNCCDGKQGGRVLFSSCWIRFEAYPFFNISTQMDSPSTPEAIIPPAVNGLPISPSSSTSKKKSYKLPIVFGVVGAVILLSALAVFLFKKHKPTVMRGDNDAADRSHNISESLCRQEEIMIFDLKTLIIATGNFHNDYKLGEGGFGPVYKGRLSDGKEIAVKKLSGRSGQGKREFMNEVKIVAKIQHRNLVKLIGCCAEGPEKLLVYEYLPNNSLDKILFDPQRRTSLDWRKRYNIIVGIARGLLYLHEDSPVRIIHRDIKASNILLDEKLNPKISDFGMARLFRDDQTYVNTGIAGTYGYMAPEYAMQGRLSVKSDVFSLGVLILEILSGRRHTDLSLPTEMQSLLGWAWRLHKRENVLDLLDSALGAFCPHEQVLRCIQIGLLCSQADATIRPLISSVILMLSSDSITMPDPTKPGYTNVTQTERSLPLNSRREIERNHGLSKTTNPRIPPWVPYGSTNDITISDLEAR